MEISLTGMISAVFALFLLDFSVNRVMKAQGMDNLSSTMFADDQNQHCEIYFSQQ